MSQSLRDEKLPMVSLRQLHSHMLSVCRTTFTNIYRYVQYCTFYTSHKLALRVRWTLEV